MFFASVFVTSVLVKTTLSLLFGRTNGAGAGVFEGDGEGAVVGAGLFVGAGELGEADGLGVGEGVGVGVDEGVGVGFEVTTAWKSSFEPSSIEPVCNEPSPRYRAKSR